MAQTSITNYFNKRKRKGEELNSRKKVFISNNGEGLTSLHSSTVFPIESSEKNVIELQGFPKEYSEYSNAKINEKPTSVLSEDNGNSVLKQTSENKCIGLVREKKTVPINLKPSAQCDIREMLKNKDNPVSNKPFVVNDENPTKNEEPSMDTKSSSPKKNTTIPVQRPVVFQLKGHLSPKKKMRADKNSENEPSSSTQNCNNNLDERVTGRKELGLMTPQKMSPGTKKQKDLTYDEMKKKLSRHAKLAELKKALSRFDKVALKQTTPEKTKKDPLNPQLQKFQTIEVEVPASPQKNIFTSPQKGYSSPQTTPTKSPAFKSYASLALPGTPTLTLPFNYRHLAEIFRCVDAVVSMLYKRKEVITFRKLKPAVQEMLRRNFTEHHLGQIKRIYPDAYIFHQEKCRKFGSASKTEHYELTLTPLFSPKVGSDSSSNSPVFTSDRLQERIHTIQRNMLEKVKDYHEEFLHSLVPPMIIPRDKLTRWHPEFEIDQVPDIEPDSLPQPPDLKKYCSAKDVLEQARNLINCNLRMEKALQTTAEESSRIEPPTTPNKLISNNSQPKISPVSSLLKGVPKALLEKVRAKQAAKALQAMTRSPAQDRIAIQHVRLPELARILRNLYVTEKKTVLPLDFTLEKLGNSYREKLSKAELQEHIQLLKNSVPGWLEIHYLRKTNYLKLSKNADMGRVLKKLEALAAEKNGR
ncbi:DNA replication factor Cdt1 [Periplaneta americana]|uniref:DNA replication factor Cdt1 n=1 Tax=Periplaneta americana TaxID=6978 RepID=UPI0037E77A50